MRVTNSQLRLLLQVVHSGSVGTAARTIGLTQSGASQAIASLEEMLGTELFSRTRSGVTPTAFTLSILSDAEIAVTAVQRIVDKARKSASHPSKPLRIASIPSIASSLMIGWRKRYQQLYPEHDISIFEGGHHDVNTWVADGVADIGITSLLPTGLSAECICREELLIVGKLGDPAILHGTSQMKALSHRTVILASGCEPIVSRLFEDNAIDVPTYINTQSITAALEMVHQGLGVTILSKTAFPRPGMEGLRARSLSPVTFRSLYMVSREENDCVDSTRRFLAIATSNEPPH